MKFFEIYTKHKYLKCIISAHEVLKMVIFGKKFHNLKLQMIIGHTPEWSIASSVQSGLYRLPDKKYQRFK